MTIPAAIAAIIERMRDRRRRQREALALAALDDRLLYDVGLTHADVDRTMREAFGLGALMDRPGPKLWPNSVPVVFAPIGRRI